MPFKLTSRIGIAVGLALGTSFVCAPLLGKAPGPPPSPFALRATGDGQASRPAQDDPALVARARGIHERVITLDTHDDINPANFTAECNYTMRLTTQVNLPKMKEGGRYRFRMPKSLAFTSGETPPNFTGEHLTFDVQVRKIVRNGALMMQQMQAQQGQQGGGEPPQQ